MIPQSRPHLRPEDFAYVPDLVRTRWVAQGPLVGQLEGLASGVLGVRHAIAVSHGTAALHLALLALGISPGDEVVAPSYACAALLHAIHYTGALPVLADVDRETFNPTVAMVRSRLTPRTKAVILTHTFGFPADIAAIAALGVPIVEDCAQALGARYRGRPVGSWGQVATGSFYATKMVCAGEGGLVATNDRRIASEIRDLTAPDRRPDYRVRYNYKLSDLAAGLAVSQLCQLDAFVARRRVIAERYSEALRDAPVRLQEAVAGTEPVYYRFVVRTPRAGKVLREARAAGIVCDRPVYRPLHRYLATERPASLQHTEAVWRTGVSVPLYPDLRDDEVALVASTLATALRAS